MAVMRVWRHLAECRRSGQEHEIDTEVPYRRPNSVAVRRCPACSEIGFNVDLEDLRKAPVTDTYVH